MNCQICGKPSGFFPLCKECNALKEKGKIIKCENCGKWHYANRPCPDCKKPTAEQTDELTCIICGENSNGKQ